MSIAQKKEMHRDLQQQVDQAFPRVFFLSSYLYASIRPFFSKASLLLQLESEILRILRKLSEEEAKLRRREVGEFPKLPHLF